METLADRIAREGPLDELDAVGWAIRLAKRIEAMHTLGVIHGSVSPACVLVEGKDRTARAYLVDVRRTSSTPPYHSPERSAGGGLSQADDTWAIACTLYAALTGAPPFAGTSDAEVRQKVLNTAPAPLAVFDVGDDDLQRVLDDAFSREMGHRTTSVSSLRKGLEEWHPDPDVGGLPGLDDEDTEGGAEEDEDDERTIMRSAPMMLANLGTAPAPRASSPGVPAPLASSPGVPAPRASSPGAVPAPRASSPGAVPAPRASSPGAVPAPRASSPGAFSPGGAPAMSPFASPRTGPAARVVPLPRASSPGAPPPPQQSAPVPHASFPGGFPQPKGPPPGLREPPRGDLLEEDEEDEKTMMRSVPENLAAAMAVRSAEHSGAFAAVAAAPTQSGSFPALSSLPRSDGEEDDEVEEEATRMMQSPAFFPPDEDEEQKTIMRPSATPEEIARITAGMHAADAANASSQHRGVDEPEGFAATMALDAMGFAPALQAPADPHGGDGQAVDGSFRAGSRPDAQPTNAQMTGDVPAGAFPPPTAFGAAPLGPPAVTALAAPPPRRVGLWIAIVLVLVLVAAGTFVFLRYR